MFHRRDHHATLGHLGRRPQEGSMAGFGATGTKGEPTGREAQGCRDGLTAAFQAVGRRKAEAVQAGGVSPGPLVGPHHRRQHRLRRRGRGTGIEVERGFDGHP